MVRDARALVVLLVDLLDASGSLLGRVRELVGNNPIVLIGAPARLLGPPSSCGFASVWQGVFTLLMVSAYSLGVRGGWVWGHAALAEPGLHGGRVDGRRLAGKSSCCGAARHLARGCGSRWSAAPLAGLAWQGQ